MKVNRIFINKTNGKNFQFKKTYKTELDIIINDDEGFIQIFALKNGYNNSLLLFEAPLYKIKILKIFVN